MATKNGDKVVGIKGVVDPALVNLLDLRDSNGLRINKDRKPIACIENIVTILTVTEPWRDVLAFNEFALSMEKREPPPFSHAPAIGEWTDGDDDELDLWLSQQYDMRSGKTDCARAAALVARRNAYHPVRQWLDTIAWDGHARVDTWLSTFLGAHIPDGDLRTADYYTKAGAWWLISAVARIYQPGCQADHVLLLEGEQGIGKSSALRILFRDWFSDTPLQIGNKDSYGNLRGVWCHELAELDSLNRAESSASKAFFSSRRDKYRPPYGERDIVAPRQVVFCGTVNHDQYLRDSTGNRRYWPVRCGKMLLYGEEGLEGVVEQLFAEAKFRLDRSELWFPTSTEDNELFREQQAQREHGDAWDTMIEEGVKGHTEISMVAIFKDILKAEAMKMTRADQMRVGECMRRLGWVKKRVGSREARTSVYVRANDEPALAVERHDVPF